MCHSIPMHWSFYFDALPKSRVVELTQPSSVETWVARTYPSRLEWTSEDQ